MTITLTRERRLRPWVYVSAFFLNASAAIAAYINSSLVESFVGEEKVGLIYTLTYILIFAIALYFHRIIEKLGVRQTIIYVLLGNILVLGVLSFFTHLPASIFFLALNLILGFLAVASLDLYLEHLSQDSITGWIRGLFLALANLAWLIFPFIASQLNSRLGFGAVYLGSSLVLLPLIYIVSHKLINFPKRSYHRTGFLRTIHDLYQAPRESRKGDILGIITIDFLLQFFYAIMVIYLPILLHEHIGFSWSEIGLILTIMLVPFVILDLTLGRVADRVGEKELIIFGLAIAGLATLLIPFLNVQSIWIWGGLLFLTRVGAATLELMKESYLFKKVDSEDISIIFLSRSMYPLSYIVAPLVATLILFLAPIQTIFIVMGLVVVLAGLPTALRLKDTG